MSRSAPPGACLAPLLLALPALALTLGGCSALSNSRLVTFGAEYWQAEAGGSVQGSDFSSIGDEVDVEDALDLEEEKTWIYYVAGTVGPTRIEATWIDLENSGLSTLTSSFDYGGQTYDAGDTVQSDLDTQVLQLHTATGIFGWEMIGFGIIAGMDQLVIDSQVNNVTDGVFAKEDYDEWIPVVGLVASASVPLWKVGVFADAEISGMLESISFDTFDGDYVSMVLRGGIDIDDGFKIGLGFRSLKADIDENEDDIDIDLGGPFLFAEMNF